MGFTQWEKYKLSDKRISKPEWHTNLEIVVLGGAIVISVIVALLDFLGALDSVPWLKDRVPILILLATVSIASYLLLERRSQLEAHESSQERLRELDQTVKLAISTIITSLDGVEFQSFDNDHELLDFVNKCLMKVKKQVDDLSCDGEPNLEIGLATTQQLRMKHLKRIDKVSQSKQYREVYIFNNPERLKKLRRRLLENAPGYSCGYYEESPFPLIQFMILDKNDIFILSDELEMFLMIRHKGRAKLFNQYYESIWKSAIKLKEGPVIHYEAVNKIFKEHSMDLLTPRSL